MDPMCHDGMCAQCWGAKFIVVGAVLIANQWWFKWDIWGVIGVLLILKGVIKLSMPACSHCQPSMATKRSRK